MSQIQNIDPPPSTSQARTASETKPERPRGLSTTHQLIVFAIILLTTLYVARGFLLPVFAALLLSYTLVPFVRFLQRIHIPRILASLMVVMSFCAISVTSLVALSGPALSWLENAPKSFDRIERLARSIEKPVQNMTAASKQLNEITKGKDESDEVVVRVEESSIAELIFDQTPIVIGGAISTMVLLFFLLAFGDTLLRRYVETSRSLRDKKRVVETARQIEKGVSSYLITVSTINLCLGLCLGSLLWIFGFQNPILWGAMACILNFIPYLGSILGVVLLTFASISVVEPMSTALIYPAIYFVLTTVEGNFITPLILGRSFTINPIFIILVLLFLGWLWGVLGAIMAVPILIGVRCAAEQFEATRTMANLMGR